jgi:2-succinyl-5-enolpyruvyl-6-hydroxy-3-cyclohexene-1-carboxylate synthase
VTTADDHTAARAEPGWVFARTLVDELARCGLTHAVVAPGSRSAPIALALAEQPGVEVSVHLDERTAAFHALGLGRATGRPAVVVCTSGTAAANFHPAVLEASHGRVPLLVLTADRPPELRGTGANQTTDQTRLYGPAVRWFADPGVARPGPDAAARWRGLAARAWAETLGRPAGPVHLNLPFVEPLVPRDLDLPPLPGRPGRQPWSAAAPTLPVALTDEASARLGAMCAGRRGVVVAGWGAGVDPDEVAPFQEVTGWPVLADKLANLGPGCVSAYDALLRVPAFAAANRPEVVLRLGAPPTSRVLLEWLGPDIPQIVVDPDGSWADPAQAARERVVADPSLALRHIGRSVGAAPDPAAWREWTRVWVTAERVAREAIDELVDTWEEPFEGRVARDLAACLPDGSTLVAGSSMPVRDLELYARPRRGLRYEANRGLSGIDGFVATALGIAAGSDGPVAALCGDLTFQHDATSVLGAAGRRPGVVFVVIDNDGGGIFSFLPQAGLPRHFETLFGTPQGRDLGALADAAGLPWRRVAKASELPGEVGEALAAGGTRVVIVPGDRALNLRRHREVQSAVAAAIA